jgi:hypothetical protein
LAEDMREALVHRRGTMGALLNCVTALEVGDSDTQAMISRPEDRYLEALMWADAAAESLFGMSGAGPVAAPARPAASADVRTRHIADQPQEPAVTPPHEDPPIAVGPDEPVIARHEGSVIVPPDPRPRGGFMARILAALFGPRGPRPGAVDRPAP